MKHPTTSALILIVGIISLLTCSCDNSREKLEAIANDENIVFPYQVGKLVINEAEVTDSSYNYLTTLPSGYFNLADSADRELLEAMLFSYITLNKKPKPNIGKANDLLPSYVQGTGQGLDLSGEVGKRPIIFIIRDEGGKMIDQFSYDFSGTDALLSSFFGIDYDVFAINTGDVYPHNPVAGEDAGVIYSPHAYNNTKSEDQFRLRKAILKSMNNEHGLINAINQLPEQALSRSVKIGVYDYLKLNADSTAGPDTTITATLRDIVKANDVTGI